MCTYQKIFQSYPIHESDMIDTNPIHAEQKNSPVDHTDRRICIYFKYTQLMQSMRHPSPLTSVPKPFCIRPQIPQILRMSEEEE